MLPEFNAAVIRFKNFLCANGWPIRLSWVPPGGIVFHNCEMFVRVVSPEHGQQLARKTYRIGKRKGLGVAMVGICASNYNTWAHVSSPMDRSAAQQLLYPLDDLKLVVPKQPRQVSLVRSIPGWWWKALVGKRWNYALGKEDQ